jgi:uncharacterized repeat protein (TIGR03803 family)
MKSGIKKPIIQLLSKSANQIKIFLIIISVILLINSSVLSQCNELYGTLSYGGISHMGAIFRTDINGENLTYVYSPEVVVKGASPRGDLCQASNGKLYGLTMSGGVNDAGVIFELDSATGEYTNRYNFNKENGTNPKGSLIQAPDGKLYGMTCYGGIYNCGVIFEWDPATNIYAKKIDLNIAHGCNPSGSLICAKNGILYGLTAYGGNYNMGVIFEWDPETENYSKLIDFQGVTNGKRPYGSLIEADNEKLYGMTSSGGSNDAGVIFEFEPSTCTLIKKIDLGKDTRHPNGSLFQAFNGKFYGMTSYGGYNDQGVLFEWDLSSNTIVQKILFTYTNGQYPAGSLIQTNNGMLYGMTAMGGANDSGVLFEFNPVTSNFIKKHDFEENIHGKGGMVFGSLCKAKNGKLYGMTNSGGPAGTGKVFEFDPLTGIHKDIVSFYNMENGANPIGSFVQAKNGKLYGRTSGGGANNMGTIFEWDPSEKRYTNKIDFDGLQTGRMPDGSMIMANNNKLYGVNMAGGSFNAGVLFEYIPETNTFTKLHDFDTETGIFPYGTLIKADNGKLYGTCSTGGYYGCGVIFEWDPATAKFSKRFDFPFVYRLEPHCAFTHASNGKLYGIRDNMLFVWDPADGSFVKKFDFNRKTDGEAVFGKMVNCEDGMYYGMTEVGGSHDVGVLFKWDPSANKYSKLFDFDGAAHGGYPYGSLFKSRNGKLYGMTTAGGINDEGVLFEWDYNTNTFVKKMDFDSKNGSQPLYGELIEYGAKSSYSVLNEIDCEKYNFNGKVLTSSGTYYDTIPNASGCDSIITLNLIINYSSLSTINATICNKYTSPSGKVWSISGEYKDTIPNSIGCDSIITINLTVNNSTSSTIQPKACHSYTSPSGRYSWKQSGTYIDTIPNAFGCDSIITIELNVIDIDPSVIQDRNVLVSKDEIAHHQWIDCNNYNLPIKGETFLTYTAEKEGNYAVIVKYGWCADTSDCVFVNTTDLIINTFESNIRLYPNPTDGLFSIDLGKEYSNTEVTISGLDGKIVQKEERKNTQLIDLSMVAAPGIYMVTISSGNERAVFRLVKN